MAKRYWLVKTEPGAYSWADMLRDRSTYWDGVRNYQARNNLKGMAEGDQVLWYHSVGDKEVVGVVEVTREHYPDPTCPDDDRWVVVDVQPVSELKEPVTLAHIKAQDDLQDVALIRQSRLSVMPLESAHFRAIVKLGRGTTKLGQGGVSTREPKPKRKKKTGKKKTGKKKTGKKKTAKKKSAKKTARKKA